MIVVIVIGGSYDYDAWYRDKCDIDKGTGSSSSSYSSSSTWYNKKTKNKQFISEVCITYLIQNIVQNREECQEDLNILFLGLCENNKTDFNSSSLTEDDITNLIISITPNDTTQIIDVFGDRGPNNELGIIIDFEKGNNITKFELCLGNVSVDNKFNKNKNKIDIGNGFYFINKNDNCTSDGLPCLS